MAFDGSGNFNLSYNWVDDYNLDILIDPTRMMGQENDIAGGLSLCITRDGQGVPSANIGWNNFRLTDLGDAVLDGDAISRVFGDGRYLQLNGTNTMAADINLGGFTVQNSGVPSNPDDLVPKSYVDAIIPAGSASVSLVSSTLIVNYFGGF